MSYEKYLKTKKWDRFKTDYFARFNPVRCWCCSEPRRLVLHHRTYERIGKERVSDVVPVCHRCHKSIHVLHFQKPRLSLWECTDRVRASKRPKSLPDAARLRGKLRKVKP